MSELPRAFDPKWPEPGASVSVDAETTAILVNKLAACREELARVDRALHFETHDVNKHLRERAESAEKERDELRGRVSALREDFTNLVLDHQLEREARRKAESRIKAALASVKRGERFANAVRAADLISARNILCRALEE